MKINTAKKQIWVKVVRGEDTAEFLLEPLAAKDSFDLITKATTVKFVRGQRDEKTDLYQLKISRLVKVIKDWKGIEDAEGNPLPCNAANIELVYNYNQDIIDEVLDKADAISEGEEEARKAIEKNS